MNIKSIGIKNIITIIFVIAIVFAFMIFSGAVKLGKDKKQTKGKVVVWGTIAPNIMHQFIDEISSDQLVVSYVRKNEDSYEEDLINAFAAGNGPDIFIMPHPYILRHVDKIFEIPYTSFPKEDFENKYIREGRIFLGEKGVYALPLSVDPVVMYYNKQLINSSFLVGVPRFWEEFAKFVKQITVKTEDGHISLAGTALGTFDNIHNAKAIVSLLLQQNGNTIVETDPLTGLKKASLQGDDKQTEKAIQALKFYTSFRNRGAQNYSWNEAMIQDREKFISGELAFYFGRASEIEKIRKKNPNLDFAVALVPQLSETSLKSTFGTMQAVAIAKHTKNLPASMQVASLLTGKDIAGRLAKAIFEVPARKDLLKKTPESNYLDVFYKSAIIANAWTDPSPKETHRIFRSLIRSLNAESLSPYEALRKANSEIDLVLNRTINKILTNKLTDVKVETNF